MTHISARRRLALTSTALLVALAGAACASSATPVAAGPGARSGTAVGSGAITPSGTAECPSTSTDPAVVRLRADPPETALPAGFHAVAAVRCLSEEHAVPGDGVWHFADAQRAETGLSTLLSALRLPDQPKPTGTLTCTLDAILVPPTALVGADGTIVVPRLPQSDCGKPLPQVLNALTALPWRTETSQKLSQWQTQLELDTGCQGEFKDLFQLPQDVSPPSAGGALTPTAVCRYAVAHGTGMAAYGGLSGAARLTAAQRAAIVSGLGAAGTTPAPACEDPGTHVVTLVGAGVQDIAVELDGCRRLRYPGGFTVPAPAALLRALESAA